MPPRDEMLAVILSAVVALAVAAFAVFAGAASEAPRATGNRAPEPACAEWTDGCIVCARTPQGLACSTPGIACTRGAVRCLKP